MAYDILAEINRGREEGTLVNESDFQPTPEEAPEDRGYDILGRIYNDRIQAGEGARIEEKVAQDRYQESLPKSWFGEAHSGFGRGVDQMQKAAYGVGALASDSVNLETARDFFLKGVEQQDREIAENPTEVSSYDKVDNFDTFMRYISSGAGEVAPNLLESVVSGVGGTVVGGPVGGVVGFVGKRAAREVIRGGVEGLVGQAASKTVKKELLDYARGRIGKEQLQDVTKGLLDKQVRKIAGRYGALGALAMSSWGQETGHIYTDLKADPNLAESDRKVAALVGGFAAAAPEVLFEGWIASKFFRGQTDVPRPELEAAKGYASKFLQTYGKEMLKTVPAEGITEFAQTVIEEAAKNWADPAKRDAIFQFDEEQRKHFIDATFKGAIGGGLAGGVAAMAQMPQHHNIKVREFERETLQRAADLEPAIEPDASDVRLSEIARRRQEIDTAMDSADDAAKVTLGEERKKLDEEEAQLVGDEPLVNESAPPVGDPATTENVQSTPVRTPTPLEAEIGHLRAFYAHKMGNRTPGEATESVDPVAVQQKRTELNSLVNENISANRLTPEEATAYREAVTNSFDEETLNFFAKENIQLRKLKKGELKNLFGGQKGYGVFIDSDDNIVVSLADFDAIKRDARVLEETESRAAKALSDEMGGVSIAVAHEIIHVADLVALRNKWKEEGSPDNFDAYETAKMDERGKAIRAALPSLPREVFAAYNFGEIGTATDRMLGQELPRMIVELARTGKMSEVTNALVKAEREAIGNDKGAISAFLREWVDAIKAVLQTIQKIFDPATAPAEIVKVYDEINKTLDKYGVLVNEKKKEATKAQPKQEPEQSSEARVEPEPKPSEDKFSVGDALLGNAKVEFAGQRGRLMEDDGALVMTSAMGDVLLQDAINRDADLSEMGVRVLRPTKLKQQLLDAWVELSGVDPAIVDEVLQEESFPNEPAWYSEVRNHPLLNSLASLVEVGMSRNARSKKLVKDSPEYQRILNDPEVHASLLRGDTIIENVLRRGIAEKLDETLLQPFYDLWNDLSSLSEEINTEFRNQRYGLNEDQRTVQPVLPTPPVETEPVAESATESKGKKRKTKEATVKEKLADQIKASKEGKAPIAVTMQLHDRLMREIGQTNIEDNARNFKELYGKGATIKLYKEIVGPKTLVNEKKAARAAVPVRPIVGPALRNPDGTVWKGQLGQTHAQLKVAAAMEGEDFIDAEHVFHDQDGNILTRKEGYQAARQTGQLNEAGLRKGDRTQPELESQDLQPSQQPPVTEYERQLEEAYNKEKAAIEKTARLVQELDELSTLNSRHDDLVRQARNQIEGQNFRALGARFLVEDRASTVRDSPVAQIALDNINRAQDAFLNNPTETLNDEQIEAIIEESKSLADRISDVRSRIMQAREEQRIANDELVRISNPTDPELDRISDRFMARKRKEGRTAARAARPNLRQTDQRSLDRALFEANNSMMSLLGAITPKEAEQRQVQGAIQFEGMTATELWYTTRPHTQSAQNAALLVNESNALNVAETLRDDAIGRALNITEDSSGDFGPNAQLRAVYENVLIQLHHVTRRLMGSDVRVGVLGYLHDLSRAVENNMRRLGNAGGSFNAYAGMTEKIWSGDSARREYAETIMENADSVIGKGAKDKFQALADELNGLMLKHAGTAATSPKVIAILRKMEKFVKSNRFAKGYRKTIVNSVDKLREIVNRGAARAATFIANDMDTEAAINRAVSEIVKDMTGMPKDAKHPDELTVFQSVIKKMARDVGRRMGVISPAATRDNPTQAQQMATILKNEDLYAEFTRNLYDAYVAAYGGNNPSQAFLDEANTLYARMANKMWQQNMIQSLVNEKIRELEIKFSEIVRDQYSRGEVEVDKVRDAIRAEMKAQGVVNEGLIDELVSDVEASMREKVEAARERFFTSKKTIRSFLSSMGESLSEVAKEHYTYAATMQAKFEESLERLGFPNVPEMPIAAELAAAMQEELNKMVAKERQEIVNRWSQKAKEATTDEDGRKLSKSVEKILQLSNIGALRSEEIYNAIRERFDLPPYNPEVAAQLQELGDAIGQSTTDRQRDIMRQKISDLMTQTKGLKTSDSYVSWMYFSMLSGISTSLVNIGGNLTRIMGDLVLNMIKHPTRLPRMMRAMVRAAVGKGQLEMREAFWTGLALGKTGEKYFRAGNPAELSDPFFKSQFQGKLGEFDERAAQFTHKLLRGIKGKYIGRGLMATDILFYKVAQEMAYTAKVGEIAMPPGVWDTAVQKARLEMLAIGDNPDGNPDMRRRQMVLAHSIYENLRLRDASGSLVNERETAWKESGTEALEATFTQEPTGFLGALARAIQSFTDEKPIGKLLVPFTRVAANVANHMLEWTPYGFARYALNSMKDGKNPLKLLEEGKWRKDSDVALRAALGTATIFALLALAAEDEDEPGGGYFTIYGDGPRDLNARRQLQQRGWKPNTIKVGDVYYSYLYTPLAMALSIVGKQLDNYRDGRIADPRDISMSSASVALLDAVKNQSFLASASDLMAAVDSPDPEAKLSRVFARFATIPLPNLIKQVDKAVDPTVQEAKGFWETFLREFPVARHTLNPALNIFGEPVDRTPGLIRFPGLERFMTMERTDDPVFNLLGEKNLTVPGISKSTRLGDENMTAEQYYEYVALVGPTVKRRIQAEIHTLGNMSQEAANERLDRISSEEKKKARAELRRKYNISR